MVVSDVERPVVIHSNHGTKEANGKKKFKGGGDKTSLKNASAPTFVSFLRSY